MTDRPQEREGETGDKEDKQIMTGPESEGKGHSEKRRETELGLPGGGGGGLGPGTPGVWRRKDEG